MILLNLNELLKFALDSVANYVSTIIFLFLLGVFAVGLLTHLAEKIAGVVVTIIMISRGQSVQGLQQQQQQQDDDKDED